LNQISTKTLPRILCLVLAVVAAPARADAYCSGNVLEYLVLNDGMLLVRGNWRGDWTNLCSLQSPWKSISIEACYSWYGLVSAAKIHNKPVGAYYYGSVECSSLATYGNSPAPLYLRMGE
jgi:hypothetical protein